ncbi:hypothetical protein Tco_1220886 [Tanacetum coccineum]
MGDDSTADEQAYSSSGEDVGRDHIPTAYALKSTYSPPPGNQYLLSTVVALARIRNVKVFHPDVPFFESLVHLLFQMEEWPQLLADQVVDALLWYNVSYHYYRFGGVIRASLVYLKVEGCAYYPDVGLEQIGIGIRCGLKKYVKVDVAAMYGLYGTICVFLSVIRIKVFHVFGYNYMKKIVLHRADLKEYVIAERDFKYLYPSDFEDLYLLNLQGSPICLPENLSNIECTDEVGALDKGSEKKAASLNFRQNGVTTYAVPFFSLSDNNVNNGMVADVRLAGQINRAAIKVNDTIMVRDQFLEKLDSLGVRHVPSNMEEFLREIQMRDKETVAKL